MAKGELFTSIASRNQLWNLWRFVASDERCHIHTVAQLLGHKDLRMAARYQHLSSSFLTEAVGKFGLSF